MQKLSTPDVSAKLFLTIYHQLVRNLKSTSFYDCKSKQVLILSRSEKRDLRQQKIVLFQIQSRPLNFSNDKKSTIINLNARSYILPLGLNGCPAHNELLYLNMQGPKSDQLARKKDWSMRAPLTGNLSQRSLRGWKALLIFPLGPLPVDCRYPSLNLCMLWRANIGNQQRNYPGVAPSYSVFIWNRAYWQRFANPTTVVPIRPN